MIPRFLVNLMWGQLAVPVLTPHDTFGTVVRKVICMMIGTSTIFGAGGAYYLYRALSSTSITDTVTAWFVLAGTLLWFGFLMCLPTLIYVRCTREAPTWLMTYSLAILVFTTLLFDQAVTFFPVRSTCIGLSLLALAARLPIAFVFVAVNFSYTVLVEVRDQFNIDLRFVSRPYEGTTGLERFLISLVGMFTLIASSVVVHVTSIEVEAANEASDNAAAACAAAAELLSVQARCDTHAACAALDKINAMYKTDAELESVQREQEEHEKRQAAAATTTSGSAAGTSVRAGNNEPEAAEAGCCTCCGSCCGGDDNGSKKKQADTVPERRYPFSAARDIAHYVKDIAHTVRALREHVTSLDDVQRAVEAAEHEAARGVIAAVESQKLSASRPASSRGGVATAGALNNSNSNPLSSPTTLTGGGGFLQNTKFSTPVLDCTFEIAVKHGNSASRDRRDEEQKQQQNDDDAAEDEDNTTVLVTTFDKDCLRLLRSGGTTVHGVILGRFDLSRFLAALASLLEHDAESLKQRLTTVVNRVLDTAAVLSGTVHSIENDVVTVSWGAIQLQTQRVSKKQHHAQQSAQYEQEQQQLMNNRNSNADHSNLPSPLSGTMMPDATPGTPPHVPTTSHGGQHQQQQAKQPAATQNSRIFNKIIEDENQDRCIRFAYEMRAMSLSLLMTASASAGLPGVTIEDEENYQQMVTAACFTGTAWCELEKQVQKKQNYNKAPNSSINKDDDDHDDGEENEDVVIVETLRVSNFSRQFELDEATIEANRQQILYFSWLRHQLPKQNGPWVRVRDSDFFYSSSAKLHFMPAAGHYFDIETQRWHDGGGDGMWITQEEHEELLRDMSRRGLY